MAYFKHVTLSPSALEADIINGSLHEFQLSSDLASESFSTQDSKLPCLVLEFSIYQSQCCLILLTKVGQGKEASYSKSHSQEQNCEQHQPSLHRLFCL